MPGLLRVRPAAPERRSKYDLWSWVRSHTIGSMGTQARAFFTPSDSPICWWLCAVVLGAEQRYPGASAYLCSCPEV